MKHMTLPLSASKLGLFCYFISLLPGGAAVSIEFATIGDAGNDADTTGYGAVAYEYRIGKYEVTNAQYANFLNAVAKTDTHGLYNTGMNHHGIARNGSSGSYGYSVTAGFENRPVVYVSWFDSARFTNWLGNGQGAGSTEAGAYSLGAGTGIVTVNPGATVYLPSEDEWYKAAYYNGDLAFYSLYPNGDDVITVTDANYNNSVGHSTDVGSYSFASSDYGTLNQAGNVWEWNDAVIGSSRGLRGGSWGADPAYNLSATVRSSSATTAEDEFIGFRVAASIASVPEPSSPLLLGLLLAAMLPHRRRS
jgi:formylglycine-generating enzyme required for sulfatase activity